jgi:hypothetical protein
MALISSLQSILPNSLHNQKNMKNTISFCLILFFFACNNSAPTTPQTPVTSENTPNMVQPQAIVATIDSSKIVARCENLKTALGAIPSEVLELTVKTSETKDFFEKIALFSKLNYLMMEENLNCDELSKLQQLSNLENLYVSTKCSLLQNTLAGHKKLKKLELTLTTKASEIPAEVSTIASLTELKVEGANLKKIPESISKLTHLETLDLGTSPIQTVTPSLKNLSGMKRVFIGTASKETIKTLLPQAAVE